MIRLMTLNRGLQNCLLFVKYSKFYIKITFCALIPDVLIKINFVVCIRKNKNSASTCETSGSHVKRVDQIK